jgi:hypothetical protein
MNTHLTPINEILDNLNGFYREHGNLPRFIEVNETEWLNLGNKSGMYGFWATGIIGGVPVRPMQTVKDWIFVQ